MLNMPKTTITVLLLGILTQKRLKLMLCYTRCIQLESIHCHMKQRCSYHHGCSRSNRRLYLLLGQEHTYIGVRSSLESNIEEGGLPFLKTSDILRRAQSLKRNVAPPAANT